MKIKSIKMHNFRSIKDAFFNLYDYSILVGANNAGKTNILNALRIFYEDISFNEKTDFPKFKTDDNESWIEIEFLLLDNEFKVLKDEYRNPGNLLKVRKYLKSDDKIVIKSKQSNIYGYENSVLSKNLFYGAKNIGQTKLGSVLYIPEVSKTDETLKLSGPSPMRNVITYVMKKVIETSVSFKNLNKNFNEFNKNFEADASKDGFSLKKLKEDINHELKEWKVEFGFNINPIKPEQIIKNLITNYVLDKFLDKEIEISSLGQGLQRHIIYTLIKLSSQYVEKKVYKQKEFSPELNLILFEEPEAFLHPSQQENLNRSLKALSLELGTQIIISTHSPFFLSKNIEDISSLIRLKRETGITKTFQVSENVKQEVMSENNELTQLFKKLDKSNLDLNTKKKIKKILGDTDDITRMEEESIRYQLWLNSERCCGFFADTVLICEGASEKVFIEYLLKNEWTDLSNRNLFVLDSMGKYNIHRYMNLFKELGILHSIIADKDKNDDIHKIINKFIIDNKNLFTKNIHFFDDNIETFLGINPPPNNRKDKKPLNIMWNFLKKNISYEKINELKQIIKDLIE